MNMQIKLKSEYVQKVTLMSLTEFKNVLEKDNLPDDTELIKALSLVIAAYTEPDD
jgi:hypothetical protein